MDTGSGDKSNADNDLYLPQTDSFWEVRTLAMVELTSPLRAFVAL